MNRVRNILDFTISSLLRRKARNISLFIVYTFVVFILASVMFFTHALRREANLILKDAPEIVVQRVMAGRHDLIPATYINRIKTIPGVRSVKGRWWGYYFDPIAGANYTLIVVNPETLISGIGLSEIASGSIIIGSGISKARIIYEGDTMPFRAYNGETLYLKIKGVLPSESELVATDTILISEGDFKKLLGVPSGYYTDTVISVANKREITTVARKITEILPDTRPIVRDEILRTYDSILNWRSGIVMMIFWGALASFIIFAWDRATGLSAEEKKEIGILKAIGWETSDVLMMKFWEGMVISLSSFFAGIILAYIHVFFTSSFIFKPVLMGWSVLYPDFRLIPFIDPYQIATLFFLVVLPYTVATIVPSWRAATIDPDSVMR
ncbi:MAG: ABC transporter permease [Thermodesulfovibrionales bacterium]